MYATPLYIVRSAVFESYQMKMKNHVKKEATKVEAMSVWLDAVSSLLLLPPLSS